jgi:hypothetical protein
MIWKIVFHILLEKLNRIIYHGRNPATRSDIRKNIRSQLFIHDCTDEEMIIQHKHRKK